MASPPDSNRRASRSALTAKRPVERPTDVLADPLAGTYNCRTTLKEIFSYFADDDAKANREQVANLARQA